MTITPPVKNPAAVALGRLGGRAGGVTSAAKAAACRRNGLLGGRPPKTPPVQAQQRPETVAKRRLAVPDGTGHS